MTVALVAAILVLCTWPTSAQIADRRLLGVTHIRQAGAHTIKIDLTSPGIRFKLTPPGGSRETIRQTTLDFLNQERAQVAVNAHFFLPWPSSDPEAWLVGMAASNGNVYSAFEDPTQSYAIVPYAPALNIDPSNHAAIVHNDTRFSDGKHVRENVKLWNTVAGSAQIITNGVKTVPQYKGPETLNGLLTPGGPGSYSNSRSWYDVPRARTTIGLSRDSRTLFLFTVDEPPGMAVGAVADLLIRDHGVYNALNLDGGGSTTLAMEDPATGAGVIVNAPSGGPRGRAVGSNLTVFAASRRDQGLAGGGRNSEGASARRVNRARWTAPLK